MPLARGSAPALEASSRVSPEHGGRRGDEPGTSQGIRADAAEGCAGAGVHAREAECDLQGTRGRSGYHLHGMRPGLRGQPDYATDAREGYRSLLGAACKRIQPLPQAMGANGLRRSGSCVHVEYRGRAGLRCGSDASLRSVCRLIFRDAGSTGMRKAFRRRVNEERLVQIAAGTRH